MFKTIMVPTDGSELSQKAVKAAIEFAKENHAKVIGLAVAEPYPYSPLAETTFLPDPQTYDKGMQEVAHAHLQQIASEAEAAGLQFEGVTALNFDPADEILATATNRGCDIIFMASHGRRGFGRLLLGGVTQKVLTQTKIPVLVFR